MGTIVADGTGTAGCAPDRSPFDFLDPVRTIRKSAIRKDAISKTIVTN
jgi:hypothetical protein